MQAKRLERVNQLMKEEISRLVQRELKDPRLGFVTITEVDATPDLRQAKIFQHFQDQEVDLIFSAVAEAKFSREI